MYPLETDPTAIQIIKRSMVCHSSMLIECLQTRAADDASFAATRETEAIKQAVMASHAATKRAIAYVQGENETWFQGDMGAGIIALNIACRLQCLPHHFKTESALRTWPE